MSMLLVSSLIAGSLAGGLCGASGAICNKLNLTTIAFAMAHGALAGAALALALNLDVLSAAMSMAIVTAILLGPLADSLRISLDLLSMILFSAYNALTFIFILMSPGQALMTERIGQLLWGSILAIRPSYILILTILLIAYLSFIAIFWRRLSSMLFDLRLAEAEGVNVKLYKCILLTLIGATIALSLRITGGFLVFSLLYLPAAASLQLFSTMKKLIAFSWIFGSISSSIGLWISLLSDLPVGSCIVIAAIILFLGSITYSRLRFRLSLREVMNLV